MSESGAKQKKVGTYKDEVAKHIRLPNPAQTVRASFSLVLKVKLRRRDRRHWMRQQLPDQIRPVQPTKARQASIRHQVGHIRNAENCGSVMELILTQAHDVRFPYSSRELEGTAYRRKVQLLNPDFRVCVEARDVLRLVRIPQDCIRGMLLHPRHELCATRLGALHIAARHDKCQAIVSGWWFFV